MALKIKNGKKYWIAAIGVYGKVYKIRQDVDGQDIIDLELDDGDTYMARKHELAKSGPES